MSTARRGQRWRGRCLTTDRKSREGALHREMRRGQDRMLRRLRSDGLPRAVKHRDQLRETKKMEDVVHPARASKAHDRRRNGKSLSNGNRLLVAKVRDHYPMTRGQRSDCLLRVVAIRAAHAGGHRRRPGGSALRRLLRGRGHRRPLGGSGRGRRRGGSFPQLRHVAIAAIRAAARVAADAAARVAVGAKGAAKERTLGISKRFLTTSETRGSKAT